MNMVKKIKPQTSDWFLVSQPSSKPKCRLYCFPYAGGNASIYRDWPNYLSADIEVCAVQLPGRGARFRETLLASMEEIVECLESAFDEVDNSVPFVFFGHSMGASIAFELSRRLQQNKKSLPEKLILSARRSPEIEVEEENFIHQLPKEEFIKKLEKLNGTPAELLAHKDLMDLMEPIIRNDFKVIETLKFKAREALQIPVSVFCGEDDHYIKEDDLLSWKKHTTKDFEICTFPGDHFYLHEYTQELLEKISSRIN